jgi:hypothetical protein
MEEKSSATQKRMSHGFCACQGWESFRPTSYKRTTAQITTVIRDRTAVVLDPWGAAPVYGTTDGVEVTKVPLAVAEGICK